MRELATRVAWRFVPDRLSFASAAIRIGIGASALTLAPLLPDSLARWAQFGGHMFVFMGLWGLLGHAERTFTDHVIVAAQRAWAWGQQRWCFYGHRAHHVEEPPTDLNHRRPYGSCAICGSVWRARY